MAERPLCGSSRGMSPEDGRFFSGAAQNKLRTTGQKAARFMVRGCAPGTVIQLVVTPAVYLSVTIWN